MCGWILIDTCIPLRLFLLGCWPDLPGIALHCHFLLVSCNRGSQMILLLSMAGAYIRNAELVPEGATGKFLFLSFAPHSILVLTLRPIGRVALPQPQLI